MSIDKWTRVNSQTFRYNSWRAIEDVTFLLPNGERTNMALKKEGPVVSVVALTVDRRIILVRQYRPGPDLVLDEIAGGRINDGELPADAARRELREETGYVAARLVELGRPLECAYSTIQRHAFIALDCVCDGAPHPDPNEFVEVILKAPAEFLHQLQLGRCTDPEVGWMALYHQGYLVSKC